MPCKTSDVDRGWAWVILAAAFSSRVVHGALVYGMGVVYVELLHKYNQSASYTSLVGSTYTSMSCFGGTGTIHARTYLSRKNIGLQEIVFLSVNYRVKCKLIFFMSDIRV